MFPMQALLKYIGDIEQIAYVRLSELTDGAGRGNRVIDVQNGSGLHFTVCPDRGFDIVEASFMGVPVAFRNGVGHRSRGEYQPEGMGWLRTWPGGLMTTCGFRNAGIPNGEFGLHGRASAAAAEDVGIVREWQECGLSSPHTKRKRYVITLRGVLREARMFGENLRLVRTITTAYGDNTIAIHDEITNQANTPDYLLLVYHCNFGYPLVSPDMRLVAAPHEVFPRDENAERGLKTWDTMPEPVKGVPEQCFYHSIPAGKDGWASMGIVNKAIGIKASVSYDTRTLPRMVQWKVYDTGTYVIGLEPTNSWLKGRTTEIAERTAQKIAPGATLGFDVKIRFEKV